MKKLYTALLLIFLLTAMLTACAPAAQTAVPTAEKTPVSFVDGLDRTVVLDETPQRIVSMAPSITEVLYAVGAGSQMVGRDSFSNYPEEAKSLEEIGGSDGTYSFEAIANLKPDLVVAAEINTPEQVKAIEDLGIKVVYLSNPTKLDEMYGLLRDAGMLTGHSAEAEELITSLQARVDAVKEKVSTSTDQPVVFYELDGSDPSKPWTSGAGTFLDQLIQMAGGVNAGSVMTDAWGQLSLEQILVQDPDLILLGDANYGTTPEQVIARTGWQGMKAVKENKIFGFNDDLVSRPGPRMVDGLEELAKLIHPELFK